MKRNSLFKYGLTVLTASTALIGAGGTAQAADKKPNIMFIMGDDIGWMQPGCYHQGLGLGETPNIDRLAAEGGRFMCYYAEQSCTAGRNAFITGIYPLRTETISLQLPGSPSFLQPGTPCLAQFLYDLGYSTGEFGKNHLGDHPAALPTAHGFQEFWGYLYHLDAMQQVSFPDINSSPTVQGVCAPCMQEPIPGIPETPGAIDPRTGTCLTPPRPIIWMKSPDGTAKNQMGYDEGPLTLERSKTVDEEISSHVIDWLDRNDPKKTGKPFFCWYNPARMHITTVLSQKYLDMVGVKGEEDSGVNEAGMKQMDDNIGYVFKKSRRDGQQLQHHHRLYHRQRSRGSNLSAWRHHPVQGREADHLGRWYAVSVRHSLAGRRQTGHDVQGNVCILDWLPTLVEIAGGPKGNELKAQIEKGAYKGIVQTTLDGVNQIDYLTGSRTSRRAKCSSIIPAQRRPQCVTRTGRCITR